MSAAAIASVRSTDEIEQLRASLEEATKKLHEADKDLRASANEREIVERKHRVCLDRWGAAFAYRDAVKRALGDAVQAEEFKRTATAKAEASALTMAGSRGGM